MAHHRIHIMGAPGAGTTSLGKALAKHIQCPHFDTDDVYWFTDDELPYRRKRNPDHRRQLLAERMATSENWVLSGSLCGWGDVFAPQFDLVVWLWLPAAVRIPRIEQRERQRYGNARLEEGGDLHLVFEKFKTWAAECDVAGSGLRSKITELAWLEKMACAVLKIEEETEIEQLLDRVLSELKPL
ncbi:MAG: AAA family ATPase [Saprospiraceae bacterium]|jgi:adenylate kinase family enzyme|nr:AAA family ATPase [Saprospiraceae bacterium]